MRAGSPSLSHPAIRSQPVDHVAVLADPAGHAGLGTLTNSLIRNGFHGVVWVGYRGVLPAYAHGHEVARVTPTCTLRFVQVETPRPFTYYKADFLDLLWKEYCPDAASICYFDTDIVVHRDWAFFRAWMRYGVALCEDQPHWSSSAASPVRSAWAEFIAIAGLQPLRDSDRYFNAGFVGVPREQRSFLKLWSTLSSVAERSRGLVGQGPEHFLNGMRDRRSPVDLPHHIVDILCFYYLHDQDCLNMAVMASRNDISPLGPAAMGFTQSFNFAMVHAVGALKPWNKPFVRHALRKGSPPTFADTLWWHYASGPVPVFPRRVIRRAQRHMTAAEILGRLVGTGR